jgi:2-keto-4-pentenoate hydratase/2-oxohepta-3-ene-1,7-dioic acid hydratase in catechol pathway
VKLVRFRAGERSCFGLLEGQEVRELEGPPFDGVRPAGVRFALSEVRLLPPVLPSKIFALAHNYRDHLGGREPPAEPQVFLKVPSSISGPEDAILLPAGAGRVDEEAELVAVIGRRCRDVRPPDAPGCVLGYTCGNDVSAREWQKKDLNWWRAKSSDTFSPLGPCIVTDLDPASARIVGRINGREVQRCLAADLIFDVSALIAWITRWVTLEPGDLIFTGTSGAPAELHDGDAVEVEIEGIGVLRNPVRRG